MISSPGLQFRYLAIEGAIGAGKTALAQRLGTWLDATVMKVLKVRDGRVPAAGDWPDPIMLDSWSADQRGGTGRAWDWEAARSLLATRRVFVAGGLQPGNVGKVVSRFKPYGVDVSSGVEARVRVKDPVKVREFVYAVRRAEGMA